MKIIDIIKGNNPSLSFEVFPPKSSHSFEEIMRATEDIAGLKPSYMSVTYGAGGTTDAYTATVAGKLSALGVPSLAHLTCIGTSKEKVDSVLRDLEMRGIENILALRGDLPQGAIAEVQDYKHASDLIRYVKENSDFCVGGACYPEGHPESESIDSDIEALKIKMESGCDFLTTQMFFDNNIFYNFMYGLLRRGITIPVVPGIMPITSAKQIKKTLSLSGGVLPLKFAKILDRYADSPEAMMDAGIAYATSQIIDLYANGVNAVHVYSMNKPEVARRIKENLKNIIG